LAYGLHLYAEQAKKPPPAEPKKADPAKPAAPAAPAAPAGPEDLLQQQLNGQFELMQGMFQLLQKAQANPGAAPNPADLNGLLNLMMRQQQKQMQILLGQQLELPGAAGPDNRAEVAQLKRLGADVKAPDEALADQLDLPRGQGQVVGGVTKDSPAAKAGLRPADVLLELDGKPVPRDEPGLARMLEEIKPNKPVNAVVLRKGKKTEVKGLSLPEAPPLPPAPEAPAAAPGGLGGNLQLPALPNFPQLPVAPLPGVGLGRGGLGPAAGRLRGGLGGVPANFTVSYQEGALSIEISGTVANGVATPSEITIRDGEKLVRVVGIDQVPEEYRDKVKDLLARKVKK
jgi:membrane-associated protease RseP (regulator of RpoE activity)